MGGLGCTVSQGPPPLPAVLVQILLGCCAYPCVQDAHHPRCVRIIASAAAGHRHQPQTLAKTSALPADCAACCMRTPFLLYAYPWGVCVGVCVRARVCGRGVGRLRGGGAPGSAPLLPVTKQQRTTCNNPGCRYRHSAPHSAAPALHAAATIAPLSCHHAWVGGYIRPPAHHQRQQGHAAAWGGRVASQCEGNEQPRTPREFHTRSP